MIVEEIKQRLQYNLDILEKHNEIHTPIFHLTDGKTYEQDLVRELITDCRELLNKIKNGTLIELPCKVGTLIYYIHKDCEAIHWREEYKPSKEFERNCVHYHPDFYESEEYCDCQDDYEHYCSQNLEIYCENCKERLTIHKEYFSLGKINQVYGTAQYEIGTKLEDTYFLTKAEAEKKLEELREKK